MDSMIWWSVLQTTFTPAFDDTKDQAYTIIRPIKMSQGEQHLSLRSPTTRRASPHY